MIHIILPGLYLFSGVCLHACLTHIWAGLRQPYHLAQIAFSATSLIAALFAIAHGYALQASDPGQFVVALKWSIALALLFCMLLILFAALYTRNSTAVTPKGLYLLLAVFFVINLVQPYSLQYEDFRELRTITLPWGEPITLANGKISAWFYYGLTTLVIGFGYVVYSFGRFYFLERRGTNLIFLLTSILLAICIVEGLLVRLSIFDFVQLGWLPFLGMVIVMSVTLSHETNRRLREKKAKLRGLFELSPLGIALTDMEGHFVEFNESFRRICGYSSNELKSLDY